MRVHLEGMGLGGALLAHRLKQRPNVELTWHDIDAPRTAWKASTGAIYPAGATNHGPDEACYNVWKSWHESGQFASSHLERSTGFVFCTNNAPHKGAYEHEAWAGDHLRSGAVSYHLNAQAFVEAQRNEFFKENDQYDADEVDVYIITHGFGSRLSHVYWGWTRLVELELYGKPLVGGDRPAFYFRKTRFEMAYAYPVPGTNWYYAGSSIIKQQPEKARDLDPVPKYERWKRIFERDGEGAVKVSREGKFLTGWRPAAAEEDTAWVKMRGNVITLRPLWNSGIRHFPMQWGSVATCLGLVP